MNKTYIAVLGLVQLIVGILATVLVVKVLLGGSSSISMLIAIPIAIRGIQLGVKNMIKLKSMTEQ